MKDVYARLEEDFRLRGLSDRSRKAYLGAVRQLERHSRRPPDELGDEEVRGYFLHLIDVRRVSPSTVNQHLYAIKFLYRVTLKRELPCLATIRPKRRRKLPAVLSVEEVRSVLKQLRVARIRACMTVIYSCGLRLLEGTHLAAADIDGDRMMLRVESGKGDKDRYVPLPVIQKVLGHSSARTTLIYTHLTEPSIVRVRETIDELMADL